MPYSPRIIKLPEQEEQEDTSNREAFTSRLPVIREWAAGEGKGFCGLSASEQTSSETNIE